MSFRKNIFLTTFFLCFTFISIAQQSIARQWNEVILSSIRKDYAKPTVHARNLFHTSVLMYDAWAIFNNADTYFLGKKLGNFTCDFSGIATPTNKKEAIKEVLSYALFRLLHYRFTQSPKATETLNDINEFFDGLGYDRSFTSIDYSNGSYRALGNYLGQQMNTFGLNDFSNEAVGYDNISYKPSNAPLKLYAYQDNGSIDPNRWQPLEFANFVDQSGNAGDAIPKFLSAEWGKVIPFALQNEDVEILNNGMFDAYIYNNPGAPHYIKNSTNNNGIQDPYKWNFALVLSWSSLLDPNNKTTINISPNSLGNVPISSYPKTFEEYKKFYNFTEGGDASTGHTVNPITNKPYADNIVKKADYARVLAEFWADGPNSETPPGHWYTILNYVNDQTTLEKKIGGVGNTVSNLEWDVKSYFVLGGALHDAAINTWGIKGYYDYVRPISAIRYMAYKGQSSDKTKPNYNPHGLPLIDGLIEIIKTGDPLAGDGKENVGWLKIKTWKGPDYVENIATETAGVGWILATHWWPYQQPNFVTPPFAGYVSGHSTFSRAAAAVLTQFTGSPFFPNGMGVFNIKKNSYLEFEQGPSEDIQLQWATYYDASDQTSLSRIWGGIHPPIDDIRGRIIGDKIGKQAFTFAKKYFDNTLHIHKVDFSKKVYLYPIPFKNTIRLYHNFTENVIFQLYSISGRNIISKKLKTSLLTENSIEIPTISKGVYLIKIKTISGKLLYQQQVIK